ncbi:MAG TPA: NTF2-like N-terminal transpeptidase domain-containing protein, partial [Candidatus Acidoferrum sp.]|nr:NTF2-like N-terminal transpeptidase domain-containing protein [Candidatus Acidoferrum sp.]
MKTIRLLAVSLLIFLAGCGPAVGTGAPTGTGPTATRGKPTAVVQVTSAPDARTAVTAFMDAWKAENYTAMYDMLTRVSKDAVTQADFTARYQDTAKNLTLKNLEYSILSTLTNPTSAQTAYQVIFHTNLVGDLTRDMTVNLVLEDGKWKVQWEDGMIMPELRGGNKLALTINVPSRGNIYDRSGAAIASQTDAVAISLHTGELIPGQEGSLLTELSRLTGKTPESIKALYEVPVSIGQNWPVVVGEASSADVEKRMGVLSGLGGLYLDKYRNRYYPDGGIAPHVVGFVSAIYPDEMNEYNRRGYR